MPKPKEKVLIELNEKDLLDLIIEAYGLDHTTSSISVSHYAGDQREREYTKVTVTGVKNDLNHILGL